MAGYIRQSSFVDGDTITAALFNNEYNQLLNAFNNATGHAHDGTAAEGPVIGLIGDAGETAPNNKVLIDTTNNFIEFYVEVSSAPVQQLYISDGAIIPVTDSDVDLGTSSLYFKNAYIDSITTTGNIDVGGNLTVTGTTTFNGGTITMGDAATDNVVFGADINSSIIPNTDDTYDLGSSSQEWRNLYIDGTANIDSLVADTADINAGTIDGVTIATSDITVGSGKTLDVSAGTLTLADDQISGDKVEGGTIAATTVTALTFGSLNDGTITVTAFVDEDNMASDSATLIPTQQSVKAYVDTTVAATNEVVEDTTPQLGGDLDLNSSDITGTGNINITGTIQSSGNITGTLATAAQPNITSVGTLSALTVDDITINGSTISDAGSITIDTEGDFIVDSEGDVYLDAAGNDWNLNSAGTNVLKVTNTSGDISIKSMTSDKDLIFKGIDGGSTITALTLDMSEAGAATFNAGATFGSSIDVTGTATMDGLTVDGLVALGWERGTFVDAAENSTFSHIFTTNDAVGDFLQEAGHLVIQPRVHATLYRDIIFAGGAGTAKPLMKLQGEGDISFYEDTGTTAKLFWDASEETLFVDQKIKVGNTTDGVVLQTSAGMGSIIGTDTGGNGWNALDIRAGSATQLYLNTSGNVGIGTDSPSVALQVQSSTTQAGRSLRLAYDGSYYTEIAGKASGGVSYNAVNPTAGGHRFEIDGTERMRIDSSGNLLVGKTASDLGVTAGIELNGQYDVGYFTRSAEKALVVNRLSTDGTIAEFRKDGTTVGSIGVISGDNLFITVE
jgi:hypothetical protein